MEGLEQEEGYHANHLRKGVMLERGTRNRASGGEVEERRQRDGCEFGSEGGWAGANLNTKESSLHFPRRNGPRAE